MKLLYVLVFLIGASVCSAKKEECDGNVGDLWLDVVVVVDNSQRVNEESFVPNIQNSISNIFLGVSIPHTRVGFVTYNSVATVNADLNKFQSYDDLMQGVYNSFNWGNLSPENTSFIATGLTSAAKLLQHQGSDYGRVNYPKVIILYASAYNGTGSLDPLPIANTLIASRITIITIALDTDHNGVIQKQLVSISSFNSAFDLDPDSPGPVQGALINANCFCPHGWLQLYDTYITGSRKYATCFSFFDSPTSWNTAKLACRNLWPGNSYLAMEDNALKHNYILEVTRNDQSFQQPPLQYHIGLKMYHGNWIWDQPYGLPQQYLDWNDWMPNYPVVSSSMTAVMNVQNSTSSGWQNIDPIKVSAGYVCEAVACSVNNFCDANWNTKNQT
ncbi:hypothetical protein GCK72_003268 [Caenorhabditis remanei]|uniref:VWFA domain-containing protein n=1 Tax=Caenorhabditis remanei TaxID=31234 RepID=A0A6A5HYP7_CAERE|nr:hypothetical protein GCK72_003268 [Caenorhabditis remanei]KAF1771442.1 hypothetical protein GCK72_003268 [Caenorhabditis remanei]